MSRYIFNPDAGEDLFAIWDYTEETWGEDQANSYIHAINAACHDLANGRKQGRPIDGIAGYLKYRVGSHFIVFCLTDFGIEVRNVLHVKRDPVRHLS